MNERMTITEAAERLGCTERRARALLKAGLLEKSPTFGKVQIVTGTSVDRTLRAMSTAGIRVLLRKRKAPNTPLTPARRDYFRKLKYGLNREEVMRRLEEQGGCAVCLCFLTEETAHVDHDHLTGAVRGMLCQPCNIALGGLKDSPAAAERAANYLRTSSETAS